MKKHFRKNLSTHFFLSNFNHIDSKIKNIFYEVLIYIKKTWEKLNVNLNQDEYVNEVKWRNL